MTMTARCISCKQLWVMTPEQIRDAQQFGVPWSPCCNTIAVVDRVEARFPTTTEPDPQPLTGATVACPECREDLDNHYPCGEPGCGCWCGDPDTPEHMLQPPRVVGS
jgi:hypothetical protein